MPRSYITRKDTGTALSDLKQVDEKGDRIRSGGSKTEGFMFGNTNFDDINNPVPAFNFVLEVEALYFIPLKSVKAFTKENEYEYIKEGGVNDYVHMKRKQISKPFTFQIERYVTTERFIDPLALGTELILPLFLYVYRYKAIQGMSKGAGGDTVPARIFIFTGCTVISKEYGELAADRSAIATETTTIAYRELIAITNPSDNNEKDEWEFKDKGKHILNMQDLGYETKYAAFSPNDYVKGGDYAYQINNGVFEKKNFGPTKEADEKARQERFDYVKRANDAYRVNDKGQLEKIIFDPTKDEDEKARLKRITDRAGNAHANKPQWEFKSGAKTKWADDSNVKPAPEAVTWPPTRRALMVENLKKR